MWKLARKMSRDTGHFGLTLVLIATLGSSQLFFGYIESYPPVAVAILWFLYSGVLSTLKNANPLAPGLALSVAVATHLACVYLLPAYLYLVVRSRKSLLKRLLWLAFPLCASLALLLSLGFGPERWVQTARTAALGLAPADMPPTAPIDFRAYPVVSAAHALDFANEVLLVIPIPIMLLLGRLAAGKIPDLGSQPADRKFLATAAAGGLAIAAALILPVAPAQDWDLFALFLIPVGIVGVQLGLPCLTGRGGLLVSAGLGLSAASLFAAFILVNAIPQSGVRRFETLVGPEAKITEFARTYGYELLAYYHRHKGDPQTALKYAQALVSREPTNHRLWAMAGTIRMSQGDYTGATADLEEAVKRGRSSAETWTNLGICFTFQQRTVDALERFRLAAAADSSRPDYQVNLALAFINAGMPDSAKALLVDTVRRWPRYEPARLALQRHFK